MATFGNVPNRLGPPDGPSSRVAVLLPGSGYSPSAPLLFFATQVLMQHGWTVQQVWWDASRAGPESDVWVADQARTAIGVERENADGLLLVGKSLGTLASPVSAEVGCPAIWLTPLLQADTCVRGIRDTANAGHQQLLVGGTADKTWQTKTVSALGVSTCEVSDADHALCIRGDAVASAEAHVTATRAMVAFADGLG